MRMRRTEGFTVVELIISTGIIAFISLWIVRWLNQPSMITRTLLSAQQSIQLTDATNLLVNDIVEADPVSVAWASLFPNATTATSLSTFSFRKANYDLSSGGSKTQVPYQYAIQSNASGTSSLMRQANTQWTTVLSPVDAPTATTPFVQIDTSAGTPANSILVMTLLYHPTGVSQPISLVRRVALKS